MAVTQFLDYVGLKLIVEKFQAEDNKKVQYSEIISACTDILTSAGHSSSVPIGGTPSENVYQLLVNSFNIKANKATSLSGYGITDAYTQEEVTGFLNDKADVESVFVYRSDDEVPLEHFQDGQLVIIDDGVYDPAVHEPDSELDIGSSNAISNSAVTQAVNGKADIAGATFTGAVNLADNTDNAVGSTAVIRGGDEDGCLTIKGIDGDTGIILAPSDGEGISQKITADGEGTITITGNVAAEGTITSGEVVADNVSSDTVDVSTLNVAEINAISDRRLKENITRVESFELDKLGTYTYNFIGDKRERVGLIAQEVQKVIPQAVTEVNNHLTIDYNAIIAALVCEVNTLKKMVVELSKQ